MALCARKISKIAAWKWVFFRLWETETLAPGGNPPGALFLYRKVLLNHELCKQIALQKQGTENRRLRLEDIKTFFSKIVIVDIIKFM